VQETFHQRGALVRGNPEHSRDAVGQASGSATVSASSASRSRSAILVRLSVPSHSSANPMNSRMFSASA
jgi:hypothetical protein